MINEMAENDKIESALKKHPELHRFLTLNNRASGQFEEWQLSNMMQKSLSLNPSQNIILMNFFR